MFCVHVEISAATVLYTTLRCGLGFAIGLYVNHHKLKSEQNKIRIFFSLPSFLASWSFVDCCLILKYDLGLFLNYSIKCVTSSDHESICSIYAVLQSLFRSI